jgi:hypothetical protein
MDIIIITRSCNHFGGEQAQGREREREREKWGSFGILNDRQTERKKINHTGGWVGYFRLSEANV